jgi:hypothetical protein
MDALLEPIGLTTAAAVQIAVLGGVLLIALVLLRIVFKLTATAFRIGCFLILLIVVAVFFLNLLS